jgi:4-hydroxybenzoate polyprenyltransferase
MSKHITNFINVTRLNKPIGFLLLFWPCTWGLSLAFYFDKNFYIFCYYLILFFLGSVLMRSAGCIVNDIVDEKIDRKVSRTKNRPIASGSLKKSTAWIYVLILCLLAFLVLIQFNFLTISLGIFSMIFAFSYPFMKRFTYWPQLFLGFTFNWGIIMSWAAIENNISYLPLLLYCGAIFWTLGYDTIYGVQDISDDEVIGVKSTAIKFKDNLNLFVIVCYLLSLITIIIVMINLKINYSIIFLGMYLLTLLYQIKIFSLRNPSNCLKAFKINNLSGLLVFLGFFTLAIDML